MADDKNKEDKKPIEAFTVEINGKVYTFDEKSKVATQFHDFKKQEAVMGELLGIEDFGNGNTYKIKQADGKEITVGSYGVLQSKITEKTIGKILRIVYIGDEKSTKSKWTYMNFDVFICEK